MEEKTTCVHCHVRVSSSANFCENCGAKVSKVRGTSDRLNSTGLLDDKPAKPTNELGQKLIFFGLMILVVSTIYYFLLGVISRVTGNWEIYDLVKPLSLFISFVSTGIALLIALGMNSGNRKTIAIIFACIYALINLYWFIDRLIPEEPFEYLEF